MKQNKRYIVKSVQTLSGPEYVIHDNLENVDIGWFDCERWAEAWAEVFEEQSKESGKNGMFKKLIR